MGEIALGFSTGAGIASTNAPHGRGHLSEKVIEATIVNKTLKVSAARHRNSLLRSGASGHGTSARKGLPSSATAITRIGRDTIHACRSCRITWCDND